MPDLAPASSTPFLRGNRTLLYGCVVSAILLAIATAYLVQGYLRTDAESRLITTTQNLAQSVEQTLTGAIDTVDVTLLAAADEISQQFASGKIDSQSITQMLIRQGKRLALADGIRATDPAGKIVYGQGILSPPIDASDREYFTRLRDAPDAGLFISKPLVGRLDKEWVWLFARRIHKADGSFGGVVFVRMNIARISRMFAQIKMQPGSVIALRGADYGLIARSIVDRRDGIPIGDQRLSTPFKAALQSNPEEGTYVSDVSVVDGIARRYSYRRSAKHGFIVLVGIELATGLAEWRRQTELIAGGLVTFIGAAVALLWLVTRNWRRQEQDFAERMRLEEKLHAFLENTAVVAWMKNFDGVYVFVSDNWLRQFNLERDAVIGKNDYAIWPKLIADRFRSQDQSIMDSGEASEFEEEIRDHEGGVSWWLVRKFPFQESDGTRLLGGMAVDITERKHQEEQRLEKERELRSTLVREVHHRIKNNLQSVAGLLQRELGRFLELDPRLDTAISQINVIAVVHGLQGIDPNEAIRLPEVVKSICKTVSMLTQSTVALTCEPETLALTPLEITSEEAVSLALVLNELILNAVKHTPRGAAPPTVTLCNPDCCVQLVIRNAMQGVPGFDIATGQGLGTGLNLVRSLLPEQGARLAYEVDQAGFMVTRLELSSPVIVSHFPDEKATDS